MKSNKLNLPENFTLTGHSGCEKTPPNSIESIKKAYESGADITEIDVRFSADGTPVLSHDAGNSNAITLEEAFAAAVPLGNMMLNLDIKETSHLDRILPLASEYSLTERIFCTGIFKNDTPVIKEQMPGCTYYLNMGIRPRLLHNTAYYKEICRIIKENDAAGLNCHHRNVTKRLVNYLHRNNLLVSLWTVDKEKDMKRVLKLGADNITTRRPSALAEMIRSKGEK